jgi:uncharacterized protein YggE
LGYETDNEVTITLCDLKKLGSVLDAVVKDGEANQVSSIRFGVKNSKKYLDEARVLATKNAMHEAKLFIQPLNVKLSTIKNIQEAGRNAPQYAYDRGEPETRISLNSKTKVATGQITFKVSVQITWDLEQ